MTPEERQAEALARWLDGPRDAPPPDLDPEIVEVVRSLQPERIPAPRVTAAEILATVTTGPLASQAGATGAPDPSQEPPDDDASTEETVGRGPMGSAVELRVEPLPSPANRSRALRRRPWVPLVFGGGAAAALAAALALIVIVPAVFFVSGPVGAPVPSADRAEAPPREGEARFDDAPMASAPSAVESRPMAVDSRGTAAAPERAARDASPVAAASEAPPSARPAASPVGRSARDEERFARQEPAAGSAAPAEAASPAPSAIREESPAVADLDEELDEPLAGSMGAAPVELGSVRGAYEAADAAPEAQAAPAAPSLAASGGRADRQRERAAKSAPEEPATATRSAAPSPPPPDPEVDARPTGPLSAVALTPKRLLDEGDPQAAADAAYAALGQAGLTRIEQADLYYVLGLAQRAKGETSSANRSFQTAQSLRAR